MDNEMRIVYREDPEWNVIGGGIHNFNIEQAGDGNDKNLCFILQNPEEAVLGGVIGQTHWDWLYISLMWIKEEYRGQGYGKRLLELAEAEGRKRGAKNVYLDTFSFQAPGFYEKQGYQVFGVLDDFPTGHKRFYLTKQL